MNLEHRLHQRARILLPVIVTVPGGELTVDMSPVARRLLLRGPAEYVTEVVMEDLYQGYERRSLFSKKGDGG